MINVYKDGNSWGAFTGTDIMEGDCEFGNTPEEAAQKLLDYLKKWRSEKYKFTANNAIEGENWQFCFGHGRENNKREWRFIIIFIFWLFIFLYLLLFCLFFCIILNSVS